jgi:parallel beta-helix repeat protein
MGNSCYWGGGGISCADNSNAEIFGNTISGNSSPWGHGGGISCSYSSPTIQENTISGNSTLNNYDGGGIFIYGSNAVISDNTISENSASRSGGGIYCSGSNPTLTGNTLSENSCASGDGGGVYVTGSSPQIASNAIKGNTATQNGGGIYWSGSTSSQLEDNEISRNAALNGNGGGVYLSSTSPSFVNQTLADNTALLGGGLYATGSSPLVKNAILWGNDSLQIYQTAGSNVQVTYSDVQQFWPGIGNINADPEFVDPGSGDYHLLSSSPCLDTGDPNPVYNDPDGSRADMGCYYFEQSTGVASAEGSPLATGVALFPAEPNPFSSSTVLVFSLPSGGPVDLSVFDISGRLVRVVHRGWMDPGVHRVDFEGSDLASGVYLYRLQAGAETVTRKLVVMK